jgi:hypothetical protein
LAGNFGAGATTRRQGEDLFVPSRGARTTAPTLCFVRVVRVVRVVRLERRHGDGWGWRRSLAHHRQGSAVAVKRLLQRLLQRLAEIAQQMPAVRHLVGSASCGALAVHTAPIPADDLAILARTAPLGASFAGAFFFSKSMT